MTLSRFLWQSIAVSVLLNQAWAQSALPNVTLPWGTWQANSLDDSLSLYTFQNIRFGKAPTGSLRFQPPQYPDFVSNPQLVQRDNTYGPSCHQVTTYSKCVAPKPTYEQNEDCLFLDVYVPQTVWQQAQKGIANTPVVVWIYGGAFEYGAKSAYGPNVPLYEGSGVIAAAQNYSENVIFVAGNYRLGAFGWLAGPTMEKEATANAGLYDQRLVLEWVQNYIHLFGGDRTHVSAWGESAGAGSILHHLMANGGQQDPLFHSVFVQSPAFQWNWDRSANGTLQQVFNNFTKLVNCTSEGDFECLINADVDTLVLANQLLYNQSDAVGLMPVGPSVDGSLIQTLPPIAYQAGLVWPNITSLAVSHVQHEAANFVPAYIGFHEAQFDYFLDYFIREPNLQPVRDAILNFYPSIDYAYDQHKRAEAVIQDSTFVCNTRWMWDGYNASNITTVYMMDYDFGNLYATHASDLLPAFWNSTWDTRSFLETYMCVESVEALLYAHYMDKIAPVYQSYLADLAVSGNPNAHSKDQAWNPAYVDNWWDNGNYIYGLLTVGDESFYLDKDSLTPWSTCGFWYTVAQNVTQQMDRMGILPKAVAAKVLESTQRASGQAQFVQGEL